MSKDSHWSQGPYNYEIMKIELFKEENQKLFLAIRDQVSQTLLKSGAITMGAAISLPSGIGSADSFTMMACVDRLVELGELQEVATTGSGQKRIFIKTRDY